jgi:flavodoxin
MKRILIAYFSRNGKNFVNGKETSLEAGNTEKIANLIHQEVGGDLFWIEPLLAYSDNYEECVKQSKIEKESNSRPAVKNKVEGMADYDVIFLGYPDWWGTCPMVVLSFLEQYNLEGKTIITFCTHEGSRSMYSLADVKASAPKARILEGQAVNGTYLSNSEATIEDWLASLKSELE